MRLSFGLSILLVAVCGAAGTTYMTCPGCIDRARVNERCEWTGDSRVPINPQTAVNRHLVADAQLAEELAIRWADAEHGRLTGYKGHGGYVEQGTARDACMARLATAIQANHDVTSEEITVARGQRSWLFDLAVGLMFLPLYLVGASVTARRLYDRFSMNHQYVRVVATALTSIVVSVLGLQLLQVWLTVWEIVRIGNDHISASRAATWTLWSQQHFDVQFVYGVVLFYLAAWCSRRPVSDEEYPIAVESDGLLLR